MPGWVTVGASALKVTVTVSLLPDARVVVAGVTVSQGTPLPEAQSS